MSLHDYLTKYYPATFAQEDMVKDFMESFGVEVRFEKNLVLFKYNMICAKFTLPITHECRGHIWRISNGTWKRVCNPPNKFFNLSEGFCPIFDKKTFEENVNQLELRTKEDGSLIDVWYDEELGDWRASTSGSITPFKVGDYDITFDKLFWQLLGESKKEVLTQIGKEYTFCFELCAVQNRIVTKYATDRVVLLLIRHTEHGTYLVPSEYNAMLGVALPKSHFLYEYGIKDQETLVRWIEDNTQDCEDAQWKEGYVVYRSGVPLAKVKTMNYLARHKFSGGDIGATRNNIIEVFFAGSLDDYYASLVDSMKVFADALKEKVITLNQKVNVFIQDLKGREFPTQKDYALWVLGNVDKQFSAFFFANKESLMKGEIDADAFIHWLKVNQGKFDAYWKS